MKFIKDNDSIFAVKQDEPYNGMMCSELFYAEIEKKQGGFQVVWQDNYREKHLFQDEGDAKQYIMLEYPKRTPHVNGPTWEIEE